MNAESNHVSNYQNINSSIEGNNKENDNLMNQVNEEATDTFSSDLPIKSLKLKKRKLNKGCSMTDIDFLNRQIFIQEVKESTREFISFTIKNSFKDKPIQHFRNEAFIKEEKDKPFDFYYDIMNLIGEGTSSIVKLCKDKSTKQIYAVKIFRAYDDECINFSINEFNNMKQVKSLYIPKVYEVFYDQNNSKIYTVMEYCTGITIKKYVSTMKSALPEFVIRSIIFHLIKGVLAIHKSGVVHR